MKQIVAAMRAIATSLVSVFFVANLTSCAGEDLEQIGIQPEKQVVDVENFSDVEAEQVNNLTFSTSDGNTLKVTVLGVTPRYVRLTPGAENSETRTINVEVIGENGDGVQRTATTSYQQRKTAGEEPAPVEPTVIDTHLEADTTMVYEVNNLQGWNNAYLRIGQVRRITRWNDGNETSEVVAERGGLISVHMALYAHDQATLFIQNSKDQPKWDGMTLLSDETSEKQNNGRNDEKRLEYTERTQQFQCTISSSIDKLMEPMTVITRDVTYTDPVSQKTITWTFNGEMKFVSIETSNGRVHAELQHSVNGVNYSKTIIDAALNTRE